MSDYLNLMRKSWKEDKKERKEKLFKYFCYSIPFFLGCLAYLEFHPEDYLDAAYFALRNYIMEYGEEEQSVLLELSRWSAFFVTASILLEILVAFGVNLKAYFKLLFSDEFVAVYGDKEMTPCLEKSLKESNVKGCAFALNGFFLSSVIKCKKIKHHVIIFDTPEENLAFYARNIAHFHGDSHIHIHLEEVCPHFFYHENKDVYHFGFADLAARSFWREICTDLNPNFSKNQKLGLNYQDKTVKIVLIGTGLVLEKLLDYAVQVNIFHPSQKIEYHIFGDMEKYESLHYNLQKEGDAYVVYPNDRLFFHQDSWSKHADTLTQATKIIICGESDSEALIIASELRSHFNITMPLYLQLRDEELLDNTMAQKSDLVIFGTRSSICTAPNITNDLLIKKAQDLALHYERLYPNSEEGKKNGEPKIEPWLKMSNFTRDSNLFSAFFWSMMFEENVQIPEAMPNPIPTSREDNFFAELEHIRWYRFHQMNNWVLAEEKNKAKRTHPCLIDFEDLTLVYKQMDWSTIYAIKNCPQTSGK